MLEPSNAPKIPAPAHASSTIDWYARLPSSSPGNDGTPWYPTSAEDVATTLHVPRASSKRIPQVPDSKRWSCPRRQRERASVRMQFSFDATSQDTVCYPGLLMPTFLSLFASKICAWLCPRDRWSFGQALPWWLPSWIVPPCNPYPRRFYGCGRDTAATETFHKRGLSSGFLQVHFAWDFLSNSERKLLEVVSPIFRLYGRLRISACCLDVSALWKDRPEPSGRPLSMVTAYQFATVLCRFDFQYSDFIRAFGGRYTYEGRDWDSSWDIVESVAHVSPPEGYPPINIERAFRILTLGVPLAGSYSCSFDSVSARNMYNNHSSLLDLDVVSKVREKFRKESELSYSILFPRWIWRFLYGIFIVPLTFVLPKHHLDDGRICHDASSTIPMPIPGTVDDGSPNEQTPAPGTLAREEENPQIYYGSALPRVLRWIWNLRIDAPKEDLMAFPDDISAAFHRAFYHPAMMVLFASVFEKFLSIPTGVIFGGKSSASYYMELGELRAWLANSFHFGHARTALTDRLQLPAPLSADAQRAIVPAFRDAINPGAAALRGPSRGSLHSSFVDDSLNADVVKRAGQAILQSVMSAYVIFGFPGSDRWAKRPAIINAIKWDEFVRYFCVFLGFVINTRSMTVAWPQVKRQRLAGLVEGVLEGATAGRRVSCRAVARTLGLLRNGCQVTILGALLSIRFQHNLNDVIRAAAASGVFSTPQATRRWWSRSFMWLDQEAIFDLQWLLEVLEPTVEISRFWTRPIGLMVPRVAQATWWSDASYQGIGGVSGYFRCMWRLTRDDLLVLGFPVTEDRSWILARDGKDAKDNLHVNLLEFIALIINAWFAIAFISRADPDNMMDHLHHFRADNMSALAWFASALGSKSPLIRRLARFFQAMLTFAPARLQFSESHIEGLLNDIADVLSRPLTKCPTWASVIAEFPNELQYCQAFRVPHELLSALQKIIVSPSTEDLLGEKMTALLTIEPKTLPDGWRTSVTMTSRWPTSHRSKAKR